MAETSFVTTAVIRIAVRQFFAWWILRLSEALPWIDAWRRGRRDRIVRIDVDPADQDRPTGIAARQSQTDLPRDVLLRLPADTALIRTTRYPMDVADMVPDLLRADIDRFTPYRPDDVALAHRTTGHDWQSKEVTVEFAVVREQVLRAVFARADAAGIRAAAAVVAGEDEDLRFANPQSERLQRSILARTNWWIVATAVLTIVALSLPAIRMQQTRIAIENDLAEVRATAEAGSDVTDRVNAIERSHRFVVEILNEAVSPMSVLSELSELMPHDSWLVSIDVQQGRMTLRGNAESASAVVSAISGSPMFSDVQFNTSAARDPRTNAERFEITARFVEDHKP